MTARGVSSPMVVYNTTYVSKAQKRTEEGEMERLQKPEDLKIICEIVSPKNNQGGFIHDALITWFPQQDLHRDNNNRHANR